jgi:glycosyltransferase A (GT-A) superfamily protein (DUF2064 family)
MTRLAAVVPAWNEAETIEDVVRGLRHAGACCVFVVDGGSMDGTPSRAEAAGARVIEERRRGYGRACLTGAAAAQAHHTHELVAFLDGDGSCNPAELPRLVAPSADADVVLGVRDKESVEGGAYPLHARIGNLCAATLIGARTRRRVRDLPPFKVLRADALAQLQLRQEGYAWTTELVARACADGRLAIAEVPTSFRARRGGKSKVSGRLMPSIRAGAQILRAAISETAPRPRLVLMAKSPRRAKSRLAAEAGVGVASGFWTASIADTAAHLMDAARDEGLEARLMLSAGDEIDDLRELIGPAWIADVQRAPGLAEALMQVFDSAVERGAPFAIAVSGDNPALPPSRVHDAVSALRGSDAVLGPTPDGGYYLVGFKRSVLARRDRKQVLHAIFDRHVSGGAARDATHGAMTAAGLSVAVLGPWSDVDDLKDLRRLATDLSAAPETAPVTSAWLTTNVRWLLPAGAIRHELQLIKPEGGESNVRG